MERLILCGGGHVSLQVAQIAQRLDFALAVIDDRPEFANPDRFPMARVLCMPFLEALDQLGRRGAGLLCHPYPGACVRPYLPGMGAAA